MSDTPKDGRDGIRQEFDFKLDGLFGELGKALNSALERLEDGASEVRRVQDIQTSRGPVRAEAGVRVRVGGAEFSSGSAAKQYEPEQTAHRAAKPGKTTEPQQSSDTVRHQIAATEMREQGLWSLSADVPGVSEKDLELKCVDGQLHISAKAASRIYEGTFDLPSGVTEDGLTVSVINGILDLTADIAEFGGTE